MKSIAPQSRPDNWLTSAKVLLSSEGARLYYWCLGVTFIWRAGLELLNQALVPIMSVGPANTTDGNVVLKAGIHGINRWFNNWDASWYSGITREGYAIHHNLHGPESIAFFPLFPYLVRYISEITHLPYIIVGLALNLLLTAGILFFIVKLTQILAHEKAQKANSLHLGKIAAVLLLLNPSAFFFATYYAEAILVFCMTAALYFAFRDKYFAAAFFAGLASGAKSIGIVMLPVILLIFIAGHKDNLLGIIKKYWLKMIAIAAASVWGLLLYMIYLWARFGSPIEFVKIETYWQRNVSGFFLKDIWQIWYEKILNPHYFAPASNYLYSLFVMAIVPVVAIICLCLLVKYRLRHLWLVALCVLTVLIPISTGTLISLNRYSLVITPPLLCYLVLYFYTKSDLSRHIVWATTYISGIVMVVFTLTYLSLHFAG